MITEKENLWRAIRHRNLTWVPNEMEAVTMIASPVVKRPSQDGRDAFGVMRSLEQDAEGGTYPTHDEHPVTDLSSWREQIALPNLDEIDAANSATHVSSLTTVTSSSPSSEGRAM